MISKVKKTVNKASENGKLLNQAWKESGSKSVYLGSGFGAGQQVLDKTAETVDKYKALKKAAEKEAKEKAAKEAAEKAAKEKAAKEAAEKALKTDEIQVAFKKNPKHDTVEFKRQLKDQENGLNSLTVDEYLANRDRYLKEGRALEGNAAQQAAREKAYIDKVDELRESGISRKEAEKQASQWMKEQAALHNPDQIAGGNPLNIGGMGDKRINSSLGSQWKYRIDAMDEQIRKMAEKMTGAEKKATYLNVKLTD
ncbi:polymorphic toxin type 15 domain-containing protein [Oceanirhabdus sp. W0125-5]|uniref:polymorphic toxin type 15 domain-containing protein n=1 Tax=Oceanirhabdus sp. W0125-5 TaxID=2999116 RepID=UPI0022F30512|nr:polymorphic toxin type 15 domain-containing protein [Oceanirhabdus sp. W0125-5]WBW97141.1 polymorphic toxin type 15 domain-containing protein [Oceanirhabdus sp. W0125-5]